MQRYSIAITALLFVAGQCMADQAQDFEFYGGGHFQVSYVEFGESSVAPDFLLSDDLTYKQAGLGFDAGLQHSNGLVAELIAEVATSGSLWGATDEVRFSQQGLLIGYAFGLSQSVQLVPKIGISNWKVEAREGAFLNPGDEEVSSERGNDTVYGVGLHWKAWENGALQFNEGIFLPLLVLRLFTILSDVS